MCVRRGPDRFSLWFGDRDGYDRNGDKEFEIPASEGMGEEGMINKEDKSVESQRIVRPPSSRIIQLTIRYIQEILDK